MPDWDPDLYLRYARERTQGRRTSKRGRWLIWIKVRLHWCYDGYQVVSSKAQYRWYTHDRANWRWRVK